VAILGRPGELSQKDGLINDLRKAAYSDKEEPTVHIAAHLAIMTVKQKLEPEHLKAIAKMLKGSHDVMTRMQAAQALSMTGPDTTAGPDLIAGLHDHDPGVVATCIVGLVQIEYPGAVQPLLRLADESDLSPELKNAARNAAYQIQRAEKTEKTEKTKSSSGQ